jgi:NitT/TauT family transport system ATP-binding protein
MMSAHSEMGGLVAQTAEPPVVDIRDFSVQFAPDVTAVSKATLSVRKGEFVSIVGPSGCGKTTLLNHAAGLLPPECVSGTFKVNGKPPKEGSHDTAYMLARDALCPWRTALANAELGAEIRGVGASERRKLALDLLEQVGLKGFENTFPKALSQGMRQRVALARTFCLDSSLLLMDEPFGALDAQTKLQLEDVLLRLWERTGRTILFVTHDLSEAVCMSDRVIVMTARPGRILADVRIDIERPRSARAMQKSPRYHELCGDLWSKLEEGVSA